MTYPFPTKMPYGPEQLRQQFGVVEDTTAAVAGLHYKIGIPLRWRQAAVPRYALPSAQQPFALIAAYEAPAGQPGRASVSVAYIEHELSPADWLSVYLAQRQETVLHQRETKTTGGDVPDVLSLSAPGTSPDQQVSRWLVVKEWASQGGAYLHVLQLSAPAPAYTAELADQFMASIALFDLMQPGQWAYAERLRTLTRREPLEFVTAYPESWQLLENPAGGAMFYQAVLTKTLYGTAVAQLTLAAVSRRLEPAIDRLPAIFLKNYSEKGQFFEPIQFEQQPLRWGAESVWRAMSAQLPAQPGAPSPADLSIWVAERGPTYAYIELYAGSRALNPEAWAVGRRALTIFLDNLRF
jgi:hypothetical protein